MSKRKKLKHRARKALEMRQKMKSIPPEHLTAQSAKLVSVWLSSPAQTRSDASHTSFVSVMSDFLYATVTLHEDWLDHLYDLKMLEFSKYSSSPNERRLQRSELSDPQLAVVEMLFVAQDFVVGTLGNSPEDLIGMIEFILKMEASPKPIDTILAHARGQEQLEKTCKPLYDAAFNYPKDCEPHSDIDMNLHEFTKSYDRRLMVAFLVTRALTSMIVKLGSTGKAEVEVSAVGTELAKFYWELSDDEFQSQKFDDAVSYYTKAIESSKYSAGLYFNRCLTALKQKNYRLAISDGYRAIVLKPQWGKAYYGQAEAFREDGNIYSAFVSNQRGIKQSENEAETEELRKQQLIIEDLMRSDTNLHELLQRTSNSELVSQKKAEKKNQKTIEREPLPPLLSDNDSMREISDDEIDVSEYFKPPSAKLTKYLNVLETVKSAQQENANGTKTTESVSDKEKTDSNSLISSTSKERKEIRKETRNDVKTSGKLRSDKVIPKEKDKKPPPRMSKNERNLNKRLKQIEAAKDKKHSSRQPAQESSDFPSVSSVKSEPNAEPEVPDSLASESRISVANAETQVTLIPGYENELNNLREEKKNLESKIHDLSDRCTRIGMSAKTETAVLNKELDSTKVALESCQKQLKDLQTKKDNEAKKFAKERSAFQETEKKLRANLSEAESKRQDAEQKLKTKEADCDRLSRILQEQRSTWLEKSAETDREKTSLSSELMVLSKRALDAEEDLSDRCTRIGMCAKTETAVLNKELDSTKVALESCQKQLKDLQTKKDNEAKKFAKERSAFQETEKKLGANLSEAESKRQDAEQKLKIVYEIVKPLQNGKTLADLTEAQPPTLPSPGPTLQKVAAPAYRMKAMGNLNSSAAPVNQFQLGTSTTSLLGNGVDALSSGSSRMSPFSPGLPKQPSPVTTSSRFTPPPGLSQFTSSPIPNDPPASTQSKGSFEKIMAQLRSSFPDVSRTDLARWVLEVRENNSLTGLSIDNIINQASVIVTTNNLSQKWTDDDPCVICQEPLRTRDIKKLKCNHSFPNACLDQWLERNRTCPTCRDFIIDKSQFPRLSAFSRR